jgi:L-alanine-DL-glutamate epimerase-like enolase superfamily enzyme
MRLYKGAFASTPERLAEEVRKVCQQGYTAIRTGLAFQPGPVVKRPWDLNHATNLIRILRESAGEDRDILDDAHGLLTLRTGDVRGGRPVPGGRCRAAG